MHHLTLAIAKKTLDMNRLKNAQNTMDHTPPDLQGLDRFYLKIKKPGKWDLKWRARYRIAHREDDRHYLHIKNQAMGKTWSYNLKDVVHKPPVKLWNIDTQFGRAGKFINHLTNLSTITSQNTLKNAYINLQPYLWCYPSQSISHRNADQSKTAQASVGTHTISTSSKGLPNTALMDNYSAYISRQLK